MPAEHSERLDSLVIEQVAFGGKGIGRLSNGKICFVPGVIPGERVEVSIQRERASYAEARLERITEASPHRVKPPCPYYGPCGGCQYQHVSYEEQLVLKTRQVADVLRRLGGVENPPVEPAVASPLPYGYRNRITVHVRRGRVGYYEQASRNLLDIAGCLIASDEVNALLGELRISHPADGEYPLRTGGSFRGFRQVNDEAATLLLEAVETLADPGGGLLVDAYCGGGFFARRLRGMFSRTIGIEWSADAVRAAQEQAGENESYLHGDVALHLADALAAGDSANTTLLLDPPAEGLAGDVVDIVNARPPRRIIYVSCNPSTLARDLKLMAGNHTLRRVIPVDMFPQTAEIETIALLECP